MNDTKSIWKSKTFWVNLFLVLPEALNLTMEGNFLPISHEQYVLLIGVINIFLRLVTNGPVSINSPKKDTVA